VAGAIALAVGGVIYVFRRPPMEPGPGEDDARVKEFE